MTQPAFQLADAPGALAVSGALTFATAAAALEAGRAQIDRLKPATLDLAGVTQADSAGLATVLALLAHARQAGGVLKVANAPRGLEALARVSGVDTLL
ncbi:STAS domain-containing protein [Bacillus sp. NP157]|nr:STAS domain-containing protein [Bacillus sp. NP157]